MIGRNELCPCGSGKKYKKCCLQKNQKIEFLKNKISYAKGLYNNVENKIYDYAKEQIFNLDRNESKQKFYISKENNLEINSIYDKYFIYDYRNNKNKTIAELFFSRNKLVLNKSQKNVLTSMINSNMSIFKIDSIDATKIIIKDCFNNEKIKIEDIELFKNLKVNDNVVTRIINIQGMNLVDSKCIKISSKNTDIILKNIKQIYKESKSNSKNIKEFLNYHSEYIYNFIQQILLNNEKYTVKPLKIDEQIDVAHNQNVNVSIALKNNIEERYLQKGLDLWKKFIKSNKSIKGSENGWAAAVEYYIKKDAGEIITQAQVSKKYEVSPRTLGKRYKELKAS